MEEFFNFIFEYLKGSWLALFALIVSILSLWLTTRYNRKKQLIDSFEVKFFEMLRLHRENVSEMSLADMKGREVFVALIKEFGKMYSIIEKRNEFESYSEIQKTHYNIILSYLLFFYGIKQNRDDTLNSMVKTFIPDKQISPLLTSILEIRGNGRKAKTNEIHDERYSYKYFDGHQLRLAHYYRHLYQIVDFVNKKKFLKPEQKKDYIKTLRAQLSNYEQAMFFLNSITPLGINWWKKGFIGEYEILKNIPEHFFKDHNIKINISSYFSEKNMPSKDQEKASNEYTYFEYSKNKNLSYVFCNKAKTASIQKNMGN